jgi:type I restriction enzyme S subunit
MSELQCVKFGDMAQQITTKVNPKDTSLNTYVGLEHLDTGSLRINRRGTPQDVIGEKLRVCKGDIIFGKRRVYQRKIAIADFDGICSAHAMVLRPKDDVIDKEFFPFFMQSDLFMERALQISVGSLSPTINWKTLAEQEFSIPLLPEQHRIATTLWAAEDCIVKGERFVAAAERAKQVLMEELFSKGIEHTEFEDLKDFGKVPSGWECKKLSDITELITKGATPTSYGYKFQKSGITFVKIESISENGTFLTDMFDFIDEETNIALKRSILEENDILFSIAGALGRVIIVNKKILPANTNQAIAIIRLDKSAAVFLEYLKYYLTSPLIQEYIKSISITTAQSNINLFHVRDFPILLPKREEQRQIAGILTRCDETIAAARENVTAAKALKMKMINEMLSPGGS